MLNSPVSAGTMLDCDVLARTPSHTHTLLTLSLSPSCETIPSLRLVLSDYPRKLRDVSADIGERVEILRLGLLELAVYGSIGEASKCRILIFSGSPRLYTIILLYIFSYYNTIPALLSRLEADSYPEYSSLLEWQRLCNPFPTPSLFLSPCFLKFVA